MIGDRARGDLLHDPAVPGKGWEGCHDLTGPRSLVCIARELRERHADRAARAARRRGSWLFRLVRRMRDWRARWDRGAEEPPAPKAYYSQEKKTDPEPALADRCPACRTDLDMPLHALCACDLCMDLDGSGSGLLLAELEDFNAGEVLAVARVIAKRDDHPDLVAAIHTVILLDLTGSLGEMAALVADVRAGFEAAPGDLPRADVN